jgi:hypothetical protein
MPIQDDDNNPYTQAFWRWWPELYNGLNTFRITGGEPLLSKQTWKILDYIKENPKPEFNLAINTNMQVPSKLIDKLIRYYNEIEPILNTFDIYTSAEAHGAQANYIRFGMNYDIFLQNVREFLNRTSKKSRVNFMINFNILSLSTFDLFLKDIIELRTEFNTTNAYNRVPMMINYLRWPEFQNVRIAPMEIKVKYIKRIKNFMLEHALDKDLGIVYLEEIDQINRLESYMLSELPEKELKKQLRDFSQFFKQYDLRREVSLPSLFPDYLNLYEEQ